MMKDNNTLNTSDEMVDSTSDIVNGSMTFGDAIEAMKHGKRVARKGWNGKGMYIYITEGYRINLDRLPVALQHDISMKTTGAVGLDQIVVNSHIDMKTADGSITVGWTASQVDMLSDDWVIVR